MSKYIAAMALATVVASSAFAQSYDPSVGSGNLNATPYRGGQTLQGGTPHDARAQARQLESRNGLRVSRGRRDRTKTP
jgi:hypothetical protein